MAWRMSLMKARSEEGSCRVPASTPAARWTATEARQATASFRSPAPSLEPRSLQVHNESVSCMIRPVGILRLWVKG